MLTILKACLVVILCFSKVDTRCPTSSPVELRARDRSAKARASPCGILGGVRNENSPVPDQTLFQVDFEAARAARFAYTEAPWVNLQQSARSADTFIQAGSALFATPRYQGPIWRALFRASRRSPCKQRFKRHDWRYTSAQALRTPSRQEFIPDLFPQCQHRLGEAKRLSQASAAPGRRHAVPVNSDNERFADRINGFRIQRAPSIRLRTWMEVYGAPAFFLDVCPAQNAVRLTR